MCAGTDGEVSLEDTLLAGAFVDVLCDGGDMRLDDAARLAWDAFENHGRVLEGALEVGRGGENLKRLGYMADVRDAVRGRNVVVVATYSAVPVLDAGWIDAGTHVTTLGPKTVSRHEVPAGLADRAAVVLTDSVAQAAGYPEPHLFPVERMVGLGAVLAGAATGRTAPDQITVFCSVGLAGTEVAVAAALWEAAR